LKYMVVDYLLITTVLMSVLGAFSNVLLWSKSFKDLTSFEAVKTVLLGGIVGVVYYFLRTEHGFPDNVAAYTVGYSVRDILDGLIVRFKPKI